MVNPKFLIICAAVGFMVSLIAGIAGGVSFAVILLRSLLFSLFAAGCGFGLRRLASKFLSVAEDTLVPEQPLQQSKPAGSSVDIILDDGDLESDGTTLSFDFKPSGLETMSRPENADTVLSQPAEKHSAVRSGESVKNASDQNEDIFEAEPVVESAGSSPAEKNIPPGAEILPDIESVSSGLLKQESEDESEPETDATYSGRRDFDGRPDSTEMVKAIRTILAKDN